MAALLLLFESAVAMAVSKPILRVCTGTVCVRHGAQLVYDAAAALSTGDEAVAAQTTCLSVCEKSIAVQLNGKQRLFDACADSPIAALDQAATAYEGMEVECSALKAAMAAKLSGDAVLAAEDWAQAVRHYSAALDGAPPGLMQSERTTAAMAAADGELSPPPSLVGMSSMRVTAEIMKLQEATAPGRVRWLHESLMGRARANLALGNAAAARSDALDATSLCPLAHPGWEVLEEVAGSDAALASEAATQLARLRPEGWEEQMAKRAEREKRLADTPKSDKKPASKAVGVAAYATAISIILACIAYRQVNPVIVPGVDM